MDDDGRKESLEKLYDDTGMGPRRPGEMREAQRRLFAQMAANEEAQNTKDQEVSNREEAKISEKSRLEFAISSLGEDTESIKVHFPELADRYADIYLKQFRTESKPTQDELMSDRMFSLHFRTILSLLQSDEKLFEYILTTFPGEWGKINAIYERIKKSSRG